jgi:two-component system NtrC family sensor kinase
MPSGGRLLVRVRSVILDGGPTTEGLAGSFAAVSLTDTGGGIPAAALPRVFEPFFTTKEVGKGTGLGLSQVYGFARQSGGTVTIDSTLGRGTTVTIYLPASTGTAAEPGFVRSPARASGRGRRILLVEDNAEVSDVVRGLLVNLGFVVQSAASGRAALDRLEAGQRFDLVFSDIVMPGELNGIDLMREVRHRYPAQPVLLTSGYSAMAEQALREGCPFLPKPYEIERVRAAVEQAMRRDDAQDIVWAGAGAVTQAGSLGRDG